MARRLSLLIGTRFALSTNDVARMLRVSHRTAQRLIAKLLAEGVIFLRYRHNCYYYSLGKYNEPNLDRNRTTNRQEP